MNVFWGHCEDSERLSEGRFHLKISLQRLWKWSFCFFCNGFGNDHQKNFFDTSNIDCGGSGTILSGTFNLWGSFRFLKCEVFFKCHAYPCFLALLSAIQQMLFYAQIFIYYLFSYIAHQLWQAFFIFWGIVKTRYWGNKRF